MTQSFRLLSLDVGAEVSVFRDTPSKLHGGPPGSMFLLEVSSPAGIAPPDDQSDSSLQRCS